MKYIKIAKFYKHIDNGGYGIQVLQTDDEYKNLTLEISSSYFGYPGVSAYLNTYGDMGAKELKEIGLMFIEAASKIELKENK